MPKKKTRNWKKITAGRMKRGKRRDHIEKFDKEE
jgi:hypothetical protein